MNVRLMPPSYSPLTLSLVMTDMACWTREKRSLICLALVAAIMARKINTTMYTCESSSDVARHTVAEHVKSVNHRARYDSNATITGKKYLQHRKMDGKLKRRELRDTLSVDKIVAMVQQTGTYTSTPANGLRPSLSDS